MPDTNKDTCSGCKHSVETEGMIGEGGPMLDLLECRRNAITALYVTRHTNETQFGWPPTDPDAKCGEFTAREPSTAGTSECQCKTCVDPAAEGETMCARCLDVGCYRLPAGGWGSNCVSGPAAKGQA